MKKAKNTKTIIQITKNYLLVCKVIIRRFYINIKITVDKVYDLDFSDGCPSY